MSKPYLQQVEALPGFDVLMTFGRSLFGLAVAVWTLQIVLRILRGQPADIWEPLFRVGLGILLLENLSFIGAFIAEIADSVSSGVMSESNPARLLGAENGSQ